MMNNKNSPTIQFGGKLEIDLGVDPDDRIYLQGSECGEIKLHTKNLTLQGLTISQLEDLQYEITEALKRNSKYGKK